MPEWWVSWLSCETLQKLHAQLHGGLTDYLRASSAKFRRLDITALRLIRPKQCATTCVLFTFSYTVAEGKVDYFRHIESVHHTAKIRKDHSAD